MMTMMSEDAKAILLLCGQLGGDSEAEPLEQTAYNAVVRWLLGKGLRPADLLLTERIPAVAQETGLAEARLTALLRRGVKLGFAVEQWNQSGIWVVCRSDPEYPARYKTHLKENAPPILFGAGDKVLLQGGGLAMIGSRGGDAAGEAFARDVAAWCARGGLPVVSGGSRGVDQVAMASALEAGGSVVGVLADSLLRRSVSREARPALADGRLLLLSPCHPETGANAGATLGCNPLIYALADYGLVVSAEPRKGGTWAGATEELGRAGGRPLFVRTGAGVPRGNTELLKLGGAPFPEAALAGNPREVLDAAMRLIPPGLPA